MACPTSYAEIACLSEHVYTGQGGSSIFFSGVPHDVSGTCAVQGPGVGFEDAQCPTSRDPLPSSISPYLHSTCADAGSGSGSGIPWHRFQLRTKN
jgi:hypothetical protein